MVPLVYAVAGEESGRLVRDYKDHPLRAVRERAAGLLGAVVAANLARHSACIEAAVGSPVAVRTTLPSLTFRAGVHPFSRLLRDVGVPVNEVLRTGAAATCHRVVSPDKFAVVDPAVVAGRHVLVFDDVWTTGSNAQSAALAVRRAGAAAVSVLVAARRLNPRYPPTGRFLRDRDRAGFDPEVCPVIGGRCA
ncbi:phosphoribosyltransferase [Mycolicibacterium arenosum]|uniref:Phosphoribosyltransferase n=1 Tax=Mycolicibacterium arenosum TaxID=2952157 RepID=A0ABT1MC87_9MYCO|nr:phosphoribosyltransferase [Mycolicibacterium sp. CAU 1645]MCP9276791.1 phosphoribosyltransferase [Mycolicibacterium sp. CAU 1645]